MKMTNHSIKQNFAKIGCLKAHVGMVRSANLPMAKKNLFTRTHSSININKRLVFNSSKEVSVLMALVVYSDMRNAPLRKFIFTIIR